MCTGASRKEKKTPWERGGNSGKQRAGSDRHLGARLPHTCRRGRDGQALRSGHACGIDGLQGTLSVLLSRGIDRGRTQLPPGRIPVEHTASALSMEFHATAD